MPYYRIKIKSFDSNTYLWIAINGKNLYEAIQKAHNRYASQGSFYVMEQTIHEIAQDEFSRQFGKSNYQVE
jgi:hypothetical protein